MVSLLSNMTYVAAQTKADGKRFVALGLAREQLVITGSVKFDIVVAAEKKVQGCLKRV